MATRLSSAVPVATRRPWLAALLSALLPGAGQAYVGALGRAGLLFLVDIGLLAIAFVAVQDRLELAKAWVSPGWLGAYMVINIAVLGYRGWAAFDAANLARGPQKGASSSHGLLTAGAIAAFLIAPHAFFGWIDLAQFNFITTVFRAEDVAGPATTVPLDSEGGTAAAATTPTLPQPALWDGLERLNVLLMGGDSGENRRAIRTDTMIVASIDPVNGNAAMFGVPRNWARVPLPEGHGVWECQCFPRILNDLYYAGEFEQPSAFPGPGTPGENAIKMGMSEFLGIPIHYYVLVDLDGFVGLIDALGGVEIDVPFRIVDEEYPHEDGITREFVDIQPGRQTLDGHLALAYARIRRHADDYARMNRQRCVLEALVEQSNPVELARAYPTILGVLKDALQTDIPVSRLGDFIELLPAINPDNVVSLRLIPPDYRNGYNDFGFSTPDVELIQSHVDIVVSNPPEVAIERLGLETLEDACS